MRFAASLLLVYTAGMLLIHISSWKLFKEWYRPGSSWIKKQLPPHRILRVEALYWSLCLASWPLWPPSDWKAIVVAFAVVHLGAWLAGELHIFQMNSEGAPSAQARKAHRFIVAFDLVEAAVLVGIGWVTLLSASHAG